MRPLSDLPYVAYHHSSLRVPFVLFSGSLDQFVSVSDLPSAPRSYSPSELDQLGERLRDLYSGGGGEGTCGAGGVRPEALVADFEGEMLGFGGEITVATFVPYTCHQPVHDAPQEQETCQPMHPPLPGLCIDMACPRGIELCKSIMESERVPKLIWGAESDTCALVHQRYPRETCMHPKRVVDVQLRYSATPQKRLALHKAIGKVLESAAPSAHLSDMRRLPEKDDSVDWDAQYAQNKRAMPFPLAEKHLLYALDDVHRVDLVLRVAGGWVDPQCATEQPAFPALDPRTAAAACTLPVPNSTDSNTERPAHTMTVVCGYDNRPRELTCSEESVMSDADLSVSPTLLRAYYSWRMVQQLSRNELDAIREDTFGLRWFYRQRKTYELAVRNRHPRVQQLRRAVLLLRHLRNVSRQCGGCDAEHLSTVLSPYDVSQIVRTHGSLSETVGHLVE